MLKHMRSVIGNIERVAVTHCDPKFKVQIWEEDGNDGMTIITEIVQGDNVSLHYHKVEKSLVEMHTVEEKVEFNVLIGDYLDLPVKSADDVSLEVYVEANPSRAGSAFIEVFLNDLSASFREAGSGVGEMTVTEIENRPPGIGMVYKKDGTMAIAELTIYRAIKFKYRGLARSAVQAIQDILYDQGGLCWSFRVLK